MSRAVKLLFREKWISKEQFEQAMVASARSGEPPGYHLVKMGAISDEDLVDFFVRRFPLRFWPRFRLKEIHPEAVAAMKPSLARHLRALPIVLAGQNLTLGLTDPSLTHIAEEAAFHTKRFINPVLLSETDMTWALDHYYPSLRLSKRPPNASAATSRSPNPAISLKPPADAKPPAVLERETHDLIPENLNPKQSIRAVINVTEGGWDIDEWGLADDDGAPSAELPGRSEHRPSIAAPYGPDFSLRPSPPERTSVFSLPSPARSAPTLPPPPKSTEVPAIPHSIASMMLGAPASLNSIAPDEGEVTKSTADLFIPKYIRESLAGDKIPKTEVEPDPSKKTIAKMMGAMHRATHRDEIIQAALDFLLLFAERAAFLVVKSNEIRGYDIKGEETNPGAIRSYWIPYSSDSLFRKTAEEKRIHLGPFGRTPSDAVFSAALGGRPRRVLVIPVSIQDRTAGILYADNLRIDMPPWNLLERIAEVAGANLYRILMERKKS